ncbi:gliding motility-associated C-terminal domain-containing protein [Gillisia sp. Hel1_33_143]|uniref:gliding motility-associated C-terminal domain-containing protein n=1 Tax=Gillisia sp. Hel1_33_143 TaxID=1336796 RepID=UPI00087B3DA5|nr:gliding motility-associated C-terminal domain-containing protein [Gillisia sp. Hel1_33_143]SDS05328.1 gliding motility-associated C-terminal domain-containing protein [Gillisia sp. Hel1_33_143]
MQNFTLGKKGISMLFFAFILLIGSSPSFGQTCPEPGDFPASQTFCYLQTIDDLDTDGFPVFQTSDTEGDTQAIPGDELLTNGAIYFVNNSTGDCRSPLSVTVTNAPRPANRITNSVVSGFEFTTCTPASFNSDNLADLFVPQTNYRIEVYGSEESTTPLIGATLNAGSSYFVGQVPTNTAAAGSCPSFRVAVGFNPNQIVAPNVETTQTFCENATVADLVAQGTYNNTQAIRWYRSQTANSPLASNTQLINGQTYFAAQVVNARGSITPPCETSAGDRAPVFVELTDPIVINTPAPGIVCETDVDAMFPSEDAIRNFYLGLLESGVPRNGTFSPDAGQIAQIYQNDADGLGDFTTTYTVGEGSCETSVNLTISVVPVQDANAGTIEDIIVDCGNTNLVILNNDILSSNATVDGKFTGTGINADGNFDPSVGPGTYTITYSVGDGSLCTTPGTSDSTTFTITVGSNSVDFGTPTTGIVCESDVDALFPSFDEIRKYYLNLLASGTPRNGTFDPTPRELSEMYQNNIDKVGDYLTTYTLGTGDCQSSVILTVSVVPVQDANAGSIANITLPCESTEIVILDNSLLSQGATPNGTFTGIGVNNDGNFDPAIGAGTYTITYSVGDGQACTTPGTSDSTTFTITVQGTDLGAPIALEECITEVAGFLTNPAAAIALYNDALAERGITDLSGTFTPSLQEVGGQILNYLANENRAPSATFVTTYNVTNSCGVSSLPISLTITDTTPANAGNIEDVIACTSQSSLDLNSILNSGNPSGGTFTINGAPITNGVLDISSTGTFTIIYTVSENDIESCLEGEDTEEFTVTVSEGTTLPSPEPSIVCESNVDALFPSFDEIRKYYLNLLPQGTPRNGTFNPTPREISQMYQNDADGLGDFTTTYTYGNGSCNNISLTVTVVPSVVANVGDIANEIVCTNQEGFNLFNLLTSANTIGGTFSNSNGTITNGILDISNAGVFDITYTVTASDLTTCLSGTSSTNFSITVNELIEANAGENIVVNYCEDQNENIDLRNLLSVQNSTRGTFSAPFEDGLFNPSTVGVGEFTITYSINGAADCAIGSDVATITINVNEVQNANAGTIDDATACTAQGTLDLSSLLTSANIAGGTFTSDNGSINNGLLDVTTAGDFNITYTVSENDPTTCLIGTDSTQFTITVNQVVEANAGENIAINYCEDQNENIDLRTLLSVQNSTRGTFSAPFEDGLFNPSTVGVGEFTITYSINGAADCAIGSDVATITINVNEVQNANAGTIDDATACTAQGTLDLSSLLTSANIAGGTFTSDNGSINNGLLDVTTAGVFNITYTVSENDPTTCLIGTDSTQFIINVTEGNANAGADNSVEVCQAEVDNFNTTQVRRFYLGLLEEGVDRNGTFNPTISEIIAQYQSNKIASFTTTYTVGNGACTDSADLTITVRESLTANAGEDVTLNFCSTESSFALVDYLNDDALTVGVFEGFEDGIFNPADNVGTTTFTYVVDYSNDNNECTTGTETATFTITVTEPQTADAGDDIAASYCVDQTEDVDLRSLLPEANRNRGTFSAPYQDGIFNPSAAGEGVVTLTYSLNGAEDCAIGTDEATITITVNGISDAPVADADQTFCFINNPTVADLSATGSNIVWYEDATLTIVAESTDPLVTGEDYYAVATADENSCGSTAVMVNVTINDSDAPTLQLEGNEFCRQDNPTVQDLVDNVNGTNVSIYSSEDGGTALVASTTLQNGITYYATSTDSDFGCESTERLAIVVKVGFCGIPEGFSPNGDQINDKFVIPDIATDYPNYTIEIFNRWGQVVFEGNASTGDWDGISNRKTTLGNDVLPAGVYFYILKYNDGVTSPVQGKLYLSR